MPKVTWYGAARTRNERRDAHFRRQIDQLMVCMGEKNKDRVGKAAGLGPNKLYRLYRDPSKLRIDDAMKLNLLFGKYQMRLGLDPMLDGGAAHGG